MCHSSQEVSVTRQCSFAVSRRESRRERDGLARRKDVAGKWELDRRLRSGEEQRCSPDSFAVWALAAPD